MTTGSAPVDNLDMFRHIFAKADALLLDFDGPVCSVFSGIPPEIVAEQLRTQLINVGHTYLPPEVNKTRDPFDVFRYAATLGDREAQYIESSLRDCEIEAVATAEPTPGTRDLIEAWRDSGRPVAVVSNNCREAVERFLDRLTIPATEVPIFGRNGCDPELLKPSPFLLDCAVETLRLSRASTVMVGDSISDLEAAKRAGILCIAYANKPAKLRTLTGSDAITTSMELLLKATTP